MKISVLIARQRSGTGALSSVLDQQPDVKCLGEVFHDNHVGDPDNFFTFLIEKVKRSPNEILPSARKRQLSEYLEYIQSRYPQNRVIILDVKYDSLHHFNGVWHGPHQIPGFLRFCVENDIQVIHLTRKNLLKTYVSGLLAEKNRVWHAQSTNEVQIKSLILDPTHTYNSLSGTSREVLFINDLLKRVKRLLTLEYEELFEQNGSISPKVESEITRFYGLSSFKHRTPAYIKQTPDSLDTVIENLSEIEKKLAGTPYSAMLT